jgi:hypothetical protein
MDDFRDQYWPLASDLVLVDTRLDQAVAWWADEGEVGEYTPEPILGPLTSMLDRLPPLTAPSGIRRLFVETRGKWVAMFNNARDREHVHLLAETASEELDTRAIGLSANRDTLRNRGRAGVPGGVTLSFFERGNAVRSLYAARVGRGWKFGQDGPPLEFEDVERYRARRVQDRLTDQLAEQYVRAWTVIEVWSADSYGPRGVVLHHRAVPVLYAQTLAEAQAAR